MAAAAGCRSSVRELTARVESSTPTKATTAISTTSTVSRCSAGVTVRATVRPPSPDSMTSVPDQPDRESSASTREASSRGLKGLVM